MKAIRVHEVGGPDVLRLEDVPDPQPAPDEVLVQIDAIGVNFIEVYQRKGLYAMQTPFTPGREGAGKVVAVGTDVTTIAVGDRVASEQLKGAYAELAVAHADRVVKLPQDLSTEVGAAIMLQGLTAHYLAYIDVSAATRRPMPRPRSGRWSGTALLSDREASWRLDHRHDVHRTEGGMGTQGRRR